MELLMLPVRTADVKDHPAAGKANNESFTNRAGNKNANARDDDSGDAFADHMNKGASPEKPHAQSAETAHDESASVTGTVPNSYKDPTADASFHESDAARGEVKTLAVSGEPPRAEADIIPETETPKDSSVSAKERVETATVGNVETSKATVLSAPLQAETGRHVETPKASVAAAPAPAANEVLTHRAAPAKGTATGVQVDVAQAPNQPQTGAPATQASSVLSAPAGVALDGVPPAEGDALPDDIIKAELPNTRSTVAIKNPAQSAGNIANGAIGQAVAEPFSSSETASEIKPPLFVQDGTASAKLVSVQPGQIVTSSLQTSSAATANAASVQLVAAIRAEPKSGDIEVRLDPPELGRVRISLSVETADAVKAVLTVERPETLEHLRRNMNQFTEDLRKAADRILKTKPAGQAPSPKF